MSKGSRETGLAVWGCRSRQTAVTVTALLRAGVAVRCLVLAGQLPASSQRAGVPLALWPTDPLPIAEQAGIPVIWIPHRKALLDTHTDPRLGAERALVSCFPWRIPNTVISRYPSGMVNIHPSLLPDYRGPAPLFWQYRDGRLRTGVTLHQVTDELDAGPVVGRAACDLPLAFPGDRLEAWLTWYGVNLFLQFLDGHRERSPRNARHVSREWARLPGPEDMLVDWEWPCWRTVHFLAGVLPLSYPVTIRDRDGRRWQVQRLVGWTPTPNLPSQSTTPLVSLAFIDGYLTLAARPL
ncbi:MAG: hypothetical protein NZ696_02045 [Thermomicrobium sp.]|nr:hypothetical protein [Thermomicrobium sp.]MDW7982377.1 formyltransferase family protein [Thermomicrobium sp.]